MKKINLFLAIVWLVTGVLVFMPYVWCKCLVGCVSLFFAGVYLKGYFESK